MDVVVIEFDIVGNVLKNSICTSIRMIRLIGTILRIHIPIIHV